MGITDRDFDWAEMAKRSLGRFWERERPMSRINSPVFLVDLMKNAYLGKIDGYSGEKVVFEG